MAHVRQPRPNSGLGVQLKVLKTFTVFISSPGLGIGDINPSCQQNGCCVESERERARERARERDIERASERE